MQEERMQRLEVAKDNVHRMEQEIVEAQPADTEVTATLVVELPEEDAIGVEQCEIPGCTRDGYGYYGNDYKPLCLMHASEQGYALRLKRKVMAVINNEASAIRWESADGVRAAITYPLRGEIVFYAMRSDDGKWDVSRVMLRVAELAQRGVASGLPEYFLTKMAREWVNMQAKRG